MNEPTTNSAAQPTKLFQKQGFWIGALVLVSAIALWPTLLNGWVNWDDQTFILNNPLVHQLSSQNVAEMFTTSQVAGGYHPLTLLSWAFDYGFDGPNAKVFHITNLLLHLFNIVLVFVFVKALCKRMDMAVIVALLFGIHPMHVEAVAWITSRKDLLFTLFYLLGLISYLKFNSANSKKHYALCLLFFVLALLSKSMAFTFPFVLLAIDYLQQRKITAKSLLPKAPFVVLAVIFAVISMQGQQHVDALVEMRNVNLLESFFVGTFGTMDYLIKAVVPFELSPFHPYPVAPGETFPWYYYASVIPVLGLAVWSFIVRKKHRAIVFGLLFFALVIGPVLQFIPVGAAVTSERFTYLSYLGLFYVMALGAVRFYDYVLEKNAANGKVLFLLGTIVVLQFGIQSYSQSKVWENGDTLWSAVIENYPEHYFAYACRANYHIEVGDEGNAMVDYSACIMQNQTFDEAYYNRGLIYLNRRDLDAAMADFQAAISINENYESAYTNIGLIHLNTNNPDAASQNFQKAIALNPKNYLNYYNQGLLHKNLQQWPLALEQFNKAIQCSPDLAMLYKERGHTFAIINDLNKAHSDFTAAIQIAPDYAEAYYWRSRVQNDLKNFDAALADALKAKELGFPIEEGYLQHLRGQG